VLFEDRTITAPLGSFSDNFVPWGCHIYRIPFQIVWTDLGGIDMEHDLRRVGGVPDGDTEPVDIGGRQARRNVDPDEDHYFYFNASDDFAYAGSRQELYVTVDYYDTGDGSIGLQYDSNTGEDLEAKYKSGGGITMTGSNEWRQHAFHLTDAWFGNRQNGGADFRIAGHDGTVFYLDVVGVSTESPLPAPVLQAVPFPGVTGVDREADLTWAPSDRATSYRVWFGTIDPPPLQADREVPSFDPGRMDFDTRYYWRVDAVNGFGATPGEVWSFLTEPFPGDFDADGDVDQEDFGRFQVCYSGFGQPHGPACTDQDLDADGDVDTADFSLLEACLSDPGSRPTCH